MGGFQIPQRYAQQSPSGDLRQMAWEVENKAHNDKPFFAMALRVAVIGGDNNGQELLSSSVHLPQPVSAWRPSPQICNRKRVRKCSVIGADLRHVRSGIDLPTRIPGQLLGAYRSGSHPAFTLLTSTTIYRWRVLKHCRSETLPCTRAPGSGPAPMPESLKLFAYLRIREDVTPILSAAPGMGKVDHPGTHDS